MTTIEVRTYTEVDADTPSCTVSSGPYPHVYLGCSQIALHISSGRTLHTRHDRLKAISDYLKAAAADIDSIAQAELVDAIREAKALHPSSEAGMFSCQSEAAAGVTVGSQVWVGGGPPEGPEREPF